MKKTLLFLSITAILFVIPNHARAAVVFSDLSSGSPSYDINCVPRVTFTTSFAQPLPGQTANLYQPSR